MELLVCISYTPALRVVRLVGGFCPYNAPGTEALVADCPPLFVLESPPLIALGSWPIACWVSDPFDHPPLFALDHPPLIALESRLIASEVSVVIWIASGNSSRISSTKSLYSMLVQTKHPLLPQSRKVSHASSLQLAVAYRYPSV